MVCGVWEEMNQDLWILLYCNVERSLHRQEAEEYQTKDVMTRGQRMSILACVRVDRNCTLYIVLYDYDIHLAQSRNE